jgi:signal peptidase II
VTRKRSAVSGVVLLLIAGTVLALDQYTKSLVRANLPVNSSWNPIVWLDRFVTLTHVNNTGAAFGLLPGYGGVFAVVAILVVVLIFVSYRQIEQGSAVLRVAFGLQLGGSLGNLCDRIARGYVTDFVDVRWWPVFNVADSALVVGTILLAVYVLFLERRDVPQQVLRPAPPSSNDAGDAPGG